MTGKLFFDIINGLIYAAMALLIYFTAKGKVALQNLDGKTFLWIFFALWFCLPELFQTALWMTGACNYLWMTVLQLLFLLPFALKFLGRENFLVKIPIMAAPGFAERQAYIEQHKHEDLIFLQPIYLPYLPEHALRMIHTHV